MTQNNGRIDPDALSHRVAKALETMCFVIADPTSPEELGDLDYHALISIDHQDEGANAGWQLGVSASRELLVEIACGLMGIEADEIDDDQVLSATVMELANIFGGEFITELGGEDLPIRPGIPIALDNGLPSENTDALIALDAMGDGLLVSLTRQNSSEVA